MKPEPIARLVDIILEKSALQREVIEFFVKVGVARGLVVKGRSGNTGYPRFASRRGKASCTGLVPATSLNMSLRRHDSTWCGALRPAVTSCRLTRHCSVRVYPPARKTALAKKVSITEPE